MEGDLPRGSNGSRGQGMKKPLGQNKHLNLARGGISTKNCNQKRILISTIRAQRGQRYPRRQHQSGPSLPGHLGPSGELEG